MLTMLQGKTQGKIWSPVTVMADGSPRAHIYTDVHARELKPPMLWLRDDIEAKLHGSLHKPFPVKCFMYLRWTERRRKAFGVKVEDGPTPQ